METIKTKTVGMLRFYSQQNVIMPQQNDFFLLKTSHMNSLLATHKESYISFCRRGICCRSITVSAFGYIHTLLLFTGWSFNRHTKEWCKENNKNLNQDRIKLNKGQARTTT